MKVAFVWGELLLKATATLLPSNIKLGRNTSRTASLAPTQAMIMDRWRYRGVVPDGPMKRGTLLLVPFSTLRYLSIGHLN